MRSLPTVLSTSFLLLGLGCDASTPAPDAAVSMDDAPTSADDAFVQGDAPMGDAGVVPGTITIGPAERPARMVVPPQHDGTTPLPIVVLLHGYSASATVQDAYFGTTRLARELGFYLILPDGTMDAGGNRFRGARARGHDTRLLHGALERRLHELPHGVLARGPHHGGRGARGHRGLDRAL
jgi:hypothetical protein